MSIYSVGDPSDDIGYINLSGFNADSSRDFRNAVILLRQHSSRDLQGLVLDLRGNPGGLLEAAVEVRCSTIINICYYNKKNILLFT